MCTQCSSFPRRSKFHQASGSTWRNSRCEGAQWGGSKILLDTWHPPVQLIQVIAVHSNLILWLFSMLVERLYFSQSCQSNVLRSCAECKKDFKKNTSLSGRRVKGRRTKARSLAVCWQRCKEKPDCRFVNWVNICSHISSYMCDPVAIEQSIRPSLRQLLGQLGYRVMPY